MNTYSVQKVYFTLLLVLSIGVGCSSNKIEVEPSPLPELEDPIKLKKHWSKRVGRGADDKYFDLQPVVYEGAVYSIGHRGVLAALDLESGKRRWQRKTGDIVTSGLSIAEDRIWYGTLQGELVCLDVAEGEELWRIKLSSEILSPVLVDGALLVAQTNDGKIYGMSYKEGRQRWVYETSVPILTLRGTNRPQVAAGAIVAAFANGKLVVLNRETGLPIWDKQISRIKSSSELERMVDIDGRFLVLDNTVFVVGFQGRMAALDLYSGAVRWQKEMSSFAGLDVAQDSVFVSDSDGVVWALDAATGEDRWRQDGLIARVPSAPALVGDKLVLGDFEGYLHWMSVESGEFLGRAKVDAKGIRMQPIVSGETVVVSGLSGKVARIGCCKK